MFKAILFLALWAFAALSVCELVENRDIDLRSIPGTLEIRTSEEAALFKKWSNVLARDVTTTITVSDCVALPNPVSSGGAWTSVPAITVTSPGSVIPGEGPVPTSVPATETTAVEPQPPAPASETPEAPPIPSSETPASVPAPTIPGTSPEPTTMTPKATTRIPEPSSIVPNGTQASATVATAATETEPAPKSSSASATTKPHASGAAGNDRVGTALVAMAVAICALVIDM